MALKPGSEPGYRAWLANDAPKLKPIFDRTGVKQKVVLMAGRHVISYYKSDRPGAVEAAFADPIAVGMMQGSLGALMDFSTGMTNFKSEFCWDCPVDYKPVHVALVLKIKAGQEAAYLNWVHHGLEPQFDAVWRRFKLAHKEVLVSGNQAMAFYRCKDSVSVLATFGEPESIAAMSGNLGPLLDLQASAPMAPFEQAYEWTA
jgi:hypothetical protein